ncbi:MAG: hypothetical protein M1828_003532 [Chrysothrix sp. TS-e1954]|nr:MAG: hypothetical protein M1828_003532 [Chrysothrix sp. TS-e1954]
MWGSSTPSRSLPFIDALFLSTSAMTEAGLNTVNLSTLNTWHQVMLLVLMMLGSAIFVSIAVVFVRVKAFEDEFTETIARKRESRRKKRRMTKGVEEDTESGASEDAVVDGGNRAAEKKSPLEQTNPIQGGQPRLRIPKALGNDAVEVEDKTKSFSRDDVDGHTPMRSSTNDSEKHARFVIPEKPERRSTNLSTPSATSPKTVAHTTGSQTPVSPLSRSNTAFSKIVGSSPREVPDSLRKPYLSFSGVGATANSTLRVRSTSSAQRHSHPTGIHPVSRAPPLGKRPTDTWFKSAAGYFTYNSQVHGLTLDERAELGGCEYSAVLFLSFLVPIYFFIWQILGAIALGARVNNNRPGIAHSFGVNPWWAGAFTAVSGFNNSGMMVIDANMVAFQDSVFFLLSSALFILAGNTAYPIFLRAIIWTMYKVLPDLPSTRFDKDTLKFLLDHPRRCYTNLFPSQHTWWLSAALVILNGTDWAFFEILNVGRQSITKLDPGIEVLDGFFQAVAVRNGGFYVVLIPNLRISLQVLYVFMMYISAYPVVITMRSSNVYEERSLGIFAEDKPDTGEDPPETTSAPASGPLTGLRRRLTHAAVAPKRENRSYFFRHQLRAQLAHDAWWIALALFLIMIVESSQFEADPVNFSVFNVIFEVVSAYATVGLSVGANGQDYSFCGSWHTLSKLIMVGVMLRGRHRGLPVAIDRAVQLRMGMADEAEEEDGRMRLERAKTFYSL